MSLDDAAVTEIVPVPDAELANVPIGIFADDPIQAIEQVTAIVRHVTALIAPRRKDFICQIQGRDYPMVVWWTAVGAFLGLMPRVVWTERIDDPPEHHTETWKARVEVYNRIGALVSSGEAICSRGERGKKQWESPALLAMAQTRATGRSFRTPLSCLAVMAGLEPTVAEDMQSGGTVEEVVLSALPDALKAMVKELKWTRGQAKAELHPFLVDGGLVDAGKAQAHLSAALDVKLAAEEDRRPQ